MVQRFLNWLRGLRFRAPSLGGWTDGLSPMTLAVLFALVAHPVVYFALTGLNDLGLVDFAALDPARVVIPAFLNILFVLQIVAVAWAVLSGGLTEVRVYGGLAALLWAFGMLLITFVALHCELFGACL